MARRKSVKLKSHGVPVDLLSVPGRGKGKGSKRERWKKKNGRKRRNRKEHEGNRGSYRRPRLEGERKRKGISRLRRSDWVVQFGGLEGKSVGNLPPIDTMNIRYHCRYAKYLSKQQFRTLMSSQWQRLPCKYRTPCASQLASYLSAIYRKRYD